VSTGVVPLKVKGVLGWSKLEGMALSGTSPVLLDTETASTTSNYTEANRSGPRHGNRIEKQVGTLGTPIVLTVSTARCSRRGHQNSEIGKTA